MKTAILLATLVSSTLLAQDATVERNQTQTPTAAEANRQQQQKLEAERRMKEALEGKAITYGGFFVDLSRAEKKSKLLSLRQPADPKNDYTNVYIEERTARPKGFVLFSLSF